MYTYRYIVCLFVFSFDGINMDGNWMGFNCIENFIPNSWNLPNRVSKDVFCVIRNICYIWYLQATLTIQISVHHIFILYEHFLHYNYKYLRVKHRYVFIHTRAKPLILIKKWKIRKCTTPFERNLSVFFTRKEHVLPYWKHEQD